MSVTDIAAADLADAVRTVRETEPLVQHVTNTVTINDVANLTLHWGGLPVMADSFGDAGEMTAAARALVINIGQVPDDRVEAMHEAGRKANDRGVPVVLDPVGLGSTPSREAVTESLLEAVDFAAIKGNYGEISALAGVEANVEGVESIGDYEAIEATAQSVADSTGTVVVASGVEDIVADADGAVRLSAGHEMLGEVVGTGCMLAATVGTFAGALEDPREAAVHGTLAFGIAGERAAAMDYAGPGSYRTNFQDAVYGVTGDDLESADLADRIEPAL
ncbi:Hydroxyethylthiazole kinase [Natrinema pellirubrum DSM 15624]|uniref:Hydroxyethylthiazole kinase n=1 Tax=Natrinema pellirubrum (strain DSM 15624 / CIP 106293 / JCM 10476 / NCIMB 786 / 157) TaxID=797303 RepID=L0JPN7_NATP1|nr:hydroxyethylthiazole kinase [Natrinema pellirubrum]AGB33490.1 hydroxyethylthiazole kinase, sugar kinase family [Natrinema pellirubrum DSM 15624]ELY70721.1 Hydroxyethylthiazole kinase [Natrinema pellirubrum DSM 15624]